MLKTPFCIGTLEVSNRIVMAPMHSGNCPDGLITDAIVDHYVSRSCDGATGLIITEFAYVSSQGRATPTQVSLADDTTLPGHSRLVEAVHAAGSKAFAQIVHAGGGTYPISVRLGGGRGRNASCRRLLRPRWGGMGYTA